MTTPAAPQVPTSGADVDQQVRALFGDLAGLLEHPELGPILRQAAQEGWDDTRLMGKLQQTNYWKTTPDTARKWQILTRLDPATADQQRREQYQVVIDMARAEGVELGDADINRIAEEALKNGWNASQTREQLYRIPYQQSPGGLATPVATQFGYLSVFLGDPEVGPLLQRAAREQWQPARLEAELQQTSFWRRTTESQRQFEALERTSPADAAQQVAARASEIAATVREIGMPLDPQRLQQIARDSVRYGWEGQQVRDAVTADFDYQQGMGGQAGQMARTVRELAAEYLIPLSDQALDSWTERMVTGVVDEEAFRAYAVEQAKSLFPGMAGALDKGVTVAQYVDPYKQIAARELEMPPEAIDLMDPKYRKMLDQVDDKGNRTAMTLAQATEYLRGTPEWQKTSGANEKAAALTESLLRSFGKVAG